MLLAALQRRAALKFPNFAINSSSTPSLPPFFRVFTSFRRINVTRSKYYSRKPFPIFFPRIRSQSIGSSRSRGIEKVNFLKNRRSLVLRASNYRIFARIPLLRSFHDHRRDRDYTKPGQRHQTPNLHSSLSTPYLRHGACSRLSSR